MREINSKYLTRKMDLCGLIEREERRNVTRKQEAQKPQQIDTAGALRRGLRSYLEEGHRETNLKRLQADPMLAFFILANRDPSSV